MHAVIGAKADCASPSVLVRLSILHTLSNQRKRWHRSPSLRRVFLNACWDQPRRTGSERASPEVRTAISCLVSGRASGVSRPGATIASFPCLPCAHKPFGPHDSGKRSPTGRSRYAQNSSCLGSLRLSRRWLIPKSAMNDRVPCAGELLWCDTGCCHRLHPSLLAAWGVMLSLRRRQWAKSACNQTPGSARQAGAPGPILACNGPLKVLLSATQPRR